METDGVHTTQQEDGEESNYSSTKTNVMFSGISEDSECNIEVKLCSHFTGESGGPFTVQYFKSEK